MSLVLENVQMKAIRTCKSKAERDNIFEVVTCSTYATCKGNPAGIYKHSWGKWELNCHESYIRCLHHKAHGGCVCAVSGEGHWGCRNLLWQENSTRNRDGLQRVSLLRAVQQGCVLKSNFWLLRVTGEVLWGEKLGEHRPSQLALLPDWLLQDRRQGKEGGVKLI